MSIIKPFTCDIPIDQLQNVDEFALEALHMDRDSVMEEFDDVYEDTRERCFSTFECKGMYASFPIERISDGNVFLTCGAVLESELLAKMLGRAEEVVMYAVTVHGFDVLMKNPDNDMFDSMFYDAWGVGYTMGVHRWIKNAIGEAAAASGRHAGRGWVPGEGDLEMGLLRDVFAALDPGQIGLELPESGLMRPVMAVCGIIGLSDDPTIADVGTEIITYH